MKKTLFAFSVTVVLSIAVFLAIGLSGCDWFNTTILGKPSQTELDEREKQRKDELSRLDSIRNAEAEKLANLEAKEAAEANGNETATKSNGAYHIIVGCYEEQINVNNMLNTLKSNGYSNATSFPMGGLTAVSAGSFGSEREAMNEIDKMYDKEFTEEIEDDIWVFNKKS